LTVLLRTGRRTFPIPVWAALGVAFGVACASLPLEIVVLSGGFLTLAALTVIDVRAGLFALLALSPLKTLIETESRFGAALPLDIGLIALAFVVAVWILRGIAEDRRLNIPYAPVYLPIVGFIMAAALSLWTTSSASYTINELIKWLALLVVAALSVFIGRRYGPLWVVLPVLAAACAQAVIGVYQFRGGSGAAHLWILDFRYFRAFGSFGQPNPFGAFMGLSLPLALGAAYGAADSALIAYRGGRRREGLQGAAVAGAFFAIAGLIGAGLLVSWSRGAWLGAGAAAFALILFAPRRRWLGIVIGVLCAAGVWGAIVVGVLPEALVARFSDFAQDLTGAADVRGVPISDANYAVIERLAHWQAAISMAEESPLLGIGFGAYEAAYGRHALVNWPLALGHAHNYYLNLLAETGIIGLVAYLGLWGATFALTLKALRRQVGIGRGIALGLLAVWIHLSVHSVFDKLYVNNLFLHIGALLGLIGALCAPPKGVPPFDARAAFTTLSKRKTWKAIL